MEEKIKIIEQTLEVSQEEAEMALNLAEGDLEQALYMGEYVSKDYVLLQIKFSHGGHNKDHGLIGLIWNGKEGESIHNDIGIIDREQINNIELAVDYQVFIKALHKIKNQENFNEEYQFEQRLHEVFNPTIIFKVFKSIKDDKKTELETIIKEKLSVITEDAIEVDIYSELITKAKLRNVFPQYFEDENLDDEEEDEEKSGKGLESFKNQLDINLSCIPIISATKGRRANQLKIGDKIRVKITENKAIAKYLNKLLKDSSGGVIGVISKLEFNKQLRRYSVIVQFGPNIYGNLIVEPEVKITIDEISIKNEKETKKLTFTKNNVIFSSILLIIIILVIILLDI